MDISSFEILEKKINQALEVLKQQQGSDDDGKVVLSKGQIDRITAKLAEISEWIEHAEV